MRTAAFTLVLSLSTLAALAAAGSSEFSGDELLGPIPLRRALRTSPAAPPLSLARTD